MARKQYNWLRFYNDFFQDKRIKRLKQLSGGGTFVVIYQEMLIQAINSDGILIYDGIMKEFYEELALDLGEQPDDVHFTIEALLNLGLLERSPDGRQYLLTEYRREDRNLVGDGNDSTPRVRKLRSNENKFMLPKKEPKTGSERKANYDAKKACIKDGHIPIIPDSENRKKYGGNYYLCFKRDGYKCKLCGSKNNLMIYQFGNEICNAQNVTSNEIGNESNVTSNEKNVTSNVTSNEICRMIAICHKCYSELGNEKNIPREVLESIDFTERSNTSNEICNAQNVTKNNDGNEKCNAKEIDIDININQSSSSACAIEPSQELFKNLVEQWNTLENYGIKKLMTIWPHGEQAREVVSLLNEFGIESFATCVAKIKNSDYLQGLTPNRKYPIDFDWFTDPENYSKVLQGKYDNRMALPDKKSKVKVMNFLPSVNSYDGENWDDLESKLLDN